MAGQENLHGLTPDAKVKEPQLPLSEVRRHGSQLIQDFGRALKDTPEFTKALIDAYWAKSAKNHEPPIKAPITFTKGDYKYQVNYSSSTALLELDELSVSKSIIDPQKHPTASNESLSIVVDAFKRTNEREFFDWKESIGYETEKRQPTGYSTTFIDLNTATAVQRVKDFLTTNFGKPQAQTPPQK